MKYIKAFEQKFRYLNDFDTSKLSLFVDEYINRQNIAEKISKLKWEIFTEDAFSYIDIFENSISSDNYSSNNSNIYYDSDEFCKKNNISTSAVENRNTLGKLIGKHYLKYVKYFDKRVIELIEMKLKPFKNPLKEYHKFYDMYGEYFTTKVKNNFQHILDSEKYNM